MSTSLLDEIIAAGPTAPEVTPRAPGRIVRDSAEIEWQIVDETTGEARRITPLPNRSMTRKPVELVRFFPPQNTHPAVSAKALLSQIAADPLKSAMLVTLLAADPPDRRSAAYTLGTQWKLTEAEADLIVSAYLAIRERMVR